MDRYRKEVLQVSTRKHGINVQYLYDKDVKCVVGLAPTKKQQLICEKSTWG